MGWKFSVGNTENLLTTMVLNFSFLKDIFPFLFTWKLTEQIPNLKLFKRWLMTRDTLKLSSWTNSNEWTLHIEELSKTGFNIFISQKEIRLKK
jgi:hypothetical protein